MSLYDLALVVPSTLQKGSCVWRRFGQGLQSSYELPVLVDASLYLGLDCLRSGVKFLLVYLFDAWLDFIELGRFLRRERGQHRRLLHLALPGWVLEIIGFVPHAGTE